MTLLKPFFYKQHIENQKLSSTPRMNFYYLKIARFLHPCYDPKIIREILKNVQKKVLSVLMRLYD